MLWLALYLPQLPIDRQEANDADEPRAVVLQEGARRRILTANHCAMAAGIKPAMALKNAYALIPNLIISDYNEHEQLQHLEQLNLWALQYSSSVTTEATDTILIEIAASLRLFGGINALYKRIRHDIRKQQLTLFTGIAPTPSAARLFARAGRKGVPDKQSLSAALADIPVHYLSLDNFTFKGLRQSGIRTLGELQKIPPAALTRRFGSSVTEQLYKLDGRLPDPKTPYRPSEVFSQSVDLPLEAPDTNALMFTVNRLLSSLGGFLKARDLGIVHLDVELHHHRLNSVTVALKFLEATANLSHLLRVTTERLNTVQLNAPVTRLSLHSRELADLNRKGKDLFQKSQTNIDTIEQIIDKLSARLGKEQIYTAIAEDDHRPEKAWLASSLERQNDPSQWPARPLWLLTEPRLLTETVTIHTLPERIENGWWDNTDVRRDYFIASDRNGSYFWIYRQRHQPDQWWVHGLFS